MAKGKKTGGRAKGTPNKATAARQQEIASSGETPIDYMLRVMRDADADWKRRDWAAQNAAPYVHPRLAATELTGKDGEPIQVETSEIDAARRIAYLLRKAADKKE